MKKVKTVASILLILMITQPYSAGAQDPITEIIRQAVKKVIVAVDLKIQRLQNKTIWLQSAQKAVENEMAKLQLTQIEGWAQKQKELYGDYFDELWRVKDAFHYYGKVKEIAALQTALVKEYRQAWDGVRQDRHFSPQEVEYIGRVFTGIITESVKNLDGVALIIRSFSIQMSDAKRMELIDAATAAIRQNYTDLKSFRTQTFSLSLNRAKDAHEVALVKGLYGIQ